MTRRWLGSADVEIDDATGAMLVSMTSAAAGMTTRANNLVAVGTDKPLFGTGGLIASINPATTRLTLIPQAGATVYYEFGSASSAASAVVPSSGIDLPYTAATTSQWHFSGSGNLQVIQSG